MKQLCRVYTHGGVKELVFCFTSCTLELCGSAVVLLGSSVVTRLDGGSPRASFLPYLLPPFGRGSAWAAGGSLPSRASPPLPSCEMRGNPRRNGTDLPLTEISPWYLHSARYSGCVYAPCDALEEHVRSEGLLPAEEEIAILILQWIEVLLCIAPSLLPTP